MKGALLLNLGSPDSPSIPDVKNYLEEFLMDERVLDMSIWKRKLILKLFILPKRPAESAHAYQQVWTDEGSPLVVTSYAQQKLTQEKTDIPVFLGMRYGSPSTADAVAEMVAAGITEVLIMPLYPHYTMSSFETALVKVTEEISKQSPQMRTTVIDPFYDDDDYIQALVDATLPQLEDDDDLLLFSYHGIPVKHESKSDSSLLHSLVTNKSPNPPTALNYREQCLATTKAFIEKSGIAEEKTAVSFQSRLLKDPWLAPYTDQELERFANEGIKKIKVVCPAFTTDCLETLEEIAIRGKEDFIAHGGESLELIPCLNTHPSWINWLANKINTFSTQ